MYIYIQKMLSQKLSSPVPVSQKPNVMSYTYGPHLNSSDGIYFGGDNRIVRCPSNRIPYATASPPAWLVADWILAERRGEPLSENAQYYIGEMAVHNRATSWLTGFLRQYEET